MRLSILIVNWHSARYVRACLRTIRAHPPRGACEIIVVDGGSFDECGAMLAAEFPQVRFVQSPTNVGFARCNNLGFRQARGAAVLFLNPDTEVQAGALDALLEALDARPGAGAVGARLLNTDGSLQVSCVQPFPTVLNQFLDADWLMRRFPRWSLWGNSILHQASLAPGEVQAVSGACLMVKRTVFEQVGGFSEDYFMYGEDLDLCLKIRRAGYGVWHVPPARLVHHGGGSSGGGGSTAAHVLMRAAVHTFLVKNRGRCYAGLYRLTMGGNACGRMVLLLLATYLGAAARRERRRLGARKWRAILCWSLRLAQSARASA